MGAIAEATAVLNAGSVADIVGLLKMRSNVEVCLPLPGSSDEIWLAACADSRLLVSGPPLVSVPPMRSPPIERASSTPDPTRVAHRKR